MRRLIEATTRNSVFANLLMAILILIGVISLYQVRSELVPQFSLDRVRIQVVWEGASPEEVEEGVCIKIEEALSGVEGIKTITSVAYEHRCDVVVELESWVKDQQKSLNEIKDEVDRINTFPDDIERPIVTEVKRVHQVLHLSLYGDVSEEVLKRKAEEIKDDLLDMDGISQVVLGGLREWEISIEVSEETLRRHGLTFEGLAGIIRRNVLDLSGGDIRSSERRIRIRTLGKRYTGPEFEKLEILTRKDGTIVRLGDIARVVDGFEDSDKSGRFDGQPAALISVFRTEQEDALRIAEMAHAYAKRKAKELPQGLHLAAWGDTSRLIQDRLDLLLRNGRIGLILVFLTLWLFLNVRLSFWVALGLPVSLMAALGYLTFTGGTLNMISMFAFIMVLGMLVDDAIVVAENIYTRMQRGEDCLTAAVEGCAEVALPVIGTVTTTIVAFVPLMMVEGTMGKFMAILPATIIAALAASLIEALFILPAHLGHWVRPPRRGTRAERMRRWIDARVNGLVQGVYVPSLRFCLGARYLVLAAAIGLFLVTIGLAAGGHVRFFFFPKFDSDWVDAKLLFPLGTPIEQTAGAARRIEQAALALNKDFRTKSGAPVIEHVFTVLGEQIQEGESTDSGSHAAHVIVELLPSEARGISSNEIVNRWRERVGEIPDTVSLTFGGAGAHPPGGMPIEVRFSGDDIAELRVASEALQKELRKYPGVFDVEDDMRPGKLEMRVSLKPEARVLGVSLQDLGQQLRSRFFGLEALRLQRGRDDVKVKLRYPLEERRALSDVENARIRIASGAEIPFYEVARVELRRGLDEIRRVDRRRVVTVTGDVEESLANPTEILSELRASFFPGLMAKHPALHVYFEGQAKESRESIDSLMRGFALAAAGIFLILATIFWSYFQPLIVMSAIPFGIVGAIWGHIIMGFDISIMSLMGIVALTGVVVNDSLVLLDFVNRYIASGMKVEDALLAAGASRWRAILLTTLTTVAGIGPMMLEKSFQAQFLIPMAVSLCFGLIFATGITLVLVPVLSLIGNDAGCLWRRMWTGNWPTREEVDVHSPVSGGLYSPAPGTVASGGADGVDPSSSGHSNGGTSGERFWTDPGKPGAAPHTGDPHR